MANDVATQEVDGQSVLARKALNLHPSTTTSLAARLGHEAPACIAAAIAKCVDDLRPVPSDSAGRKSWRDSIDKRLCKLAVKVLPTASPAATEQWREAMADALSDLPAMISLTAAKRAIHHPFRFIAEIEATVRQISVELIAEREDRLAAMRRHRAEIDRALNPPAPLLAPPTERGPLPPDQVAKVNAWMRTHGLRTRFTEDGGSYQEEPVMEQEAA